MTRRAAEGSTSASRRLLGAGAAVLLLAATAACGPDADADSDTTLRVLAAASLTESFDELAGDFEAAHPNVDVQVSYDSSAVLAEQVVQGNTADVLATADETTMQSVVDAGETASDPLPFASNTLVIATPPDNPAGIADVDDLAGATFAVCVPDAPCGDAAARLLELDRITAAPATEEQNVKGVLTKVTLGEVDAGLVYASDAVAAGDAVHVVVPQRAGEIVNVDPIAVLAAGDQTGLAQEFVDLVLSGEGQAVLARHGFGPAS
ncbi:molybdate transport system substrate-binding protein [Mumia flava]|uniref:Molybdate transport system substrate-binding protein n=1 Tax=Mumia flava TaxID=1348852 RepID=A0A0B2B771_9ACTN|nr:molybdate ABC transporter substrate-binding protein [Mumia flava]PJJ56780.1 molybdate transport system substrate-binding protein [Mumia flava]